MKLLNIICLVILQIGITQGQTLELSPSNPTSDDCIYLYTEVITPTLSRASGVEIVNDGNDIDMESCYMWSSLQAIGYYYDTINIGRKEQGIYTVNYTVYRPRYEERCEDADTTFAQLTFEVSDSASEEIACHELEVNIYPNPTKGTEEGFYISSNESLLLIEIFDASGKLIRELNRGGRRYYNFSEFLFPLPGVYYLRFNGNSTNSITKQVIRL